MKPQTEWYVIGEILSLLACFVGIAGGLFALAQFHYPERQDGFGRWLGSAWRLVESTPLYDLPRTLTIRVITAHDALARRVEQALLSNIGVVLIILGSFIFIGVGSRWAGWFWNFRYFSFRSPGLMLFCCFVFRFVAKRISLVLRRVTDAVFYVGVFFLFFGLYYRMIEKSLTLPNPAHALAALAVLSPAAMYLPGFALPAMKSLAEWFGWMKTSDEADRMQVTGGLALGVSFSVTMAALVFGTMVSPSEALPRGARLFLSNVIFDALTFAATVVILRRAQESSRSFAILAAIVVDLLVSALFACASLWLGVVGSKDALSVVGVACTLVARDPSCRSVQLGPFFWAMHTSLLPTAACLLLLALAVGGRVLARTVVPVLKSAESHPYNYSATLLGLSAALIGGIAQVFKWM